MLLIACVLAACSGTTSLFKDDTTASTSRADTPPPVVLKGLAGLPPDKSKAFKEALAVTAGRRDIVTVEGNWDGKSYALAGSFKLEQSMLAYALELRDNSGVLVTSLDGSEAASVQTGENPWSAVTNDVLQRAADKIASDLASKFAGLGYATRQASLMSPPSYMFVGAGPNAGKDIDLETYYGPNGRNMAMLGLPGSPEYTATLQKDISSDISELNKHAASAPVSKPLPGEGEFAVADAQSDGLIEPEGKKETKPIAEETILLAGTISEDEPQGAKTAKAIDKPGTVEIAAADTALAVPESAKPKAAKAAPPGQVEIKAVTVVGVEGAGPGNRELTEAMRKTLKEAGWPVLTKPRADSLTIVGRVALSKESNGKQNVKLHWIVKTPSGKPLGDVKQSNDVPAGSLDKGWGEAAVAVAQAAAPGIFDIVNRYR